MMEIRRASTGPYGASFWMTDAELGEWHGVTVDEEGRVIELKLNDNGPACR